GADPDRTRGTDRRHGEPSPVRAARAARPTARWIFAPM
ncbi:MAG: hypothetical protein AVDCRST_MAG21-1266, partial [uncultured Nocardioidaceae bacterium]